MGSKKSQESLMEDVEISLNLKDATDDIAYSQAIINILNHSIPAMLAFFFEFSYHVVSLIIVGHLNDPAALGGVGLGSITINVLCVSLCVGMNGAIDTLVSQAFGDKEYYLCGCYLNRGRIINSIMFVPQCIILLYSKEIMLAIGQEPESVEHAYLYIRAFLPGLYTLIQFEITRRYIQCMGVFAVSMYIQGTTLILHAALCYLLVFTFDFKTSGAGMACTITYTVNFVLITSYVHFKTDLIPREAWHWFNRDSFKGFMEYTILGVFSMMMMCVEWWSFEFLSLYAGWLSVNELACNVILLSILALAYQFPLGMSFSICNLVGNSIGDQKPHKAKKYFKASILCGLLLATICGIIMIAFRHQVPLLYTSDQELVEKAASLIPVFIILLFFDYVHVVLSGSIRAVGYQHLASIASVISYWITMLPAAYLFCFVFDLRLLGIWLGVPCGALVQASALLLILICIDWQKLVLQAIERIDGDKNEVESESEQELSNISL